MYQNFMESSSERTQERELKREALKEDRIGVDELGAL